MSFGANYYLLTSLPMLPEPGAVPPVSARDLRARAADSDAAPLVDVVLLEEDLRWRQAMLAGEVTDADSSVLTREQVSGEAPLPAALAAGRRGGSRRLPADRIWRAYWSHAARTARQQRSRFLGSWVRVEVALRNGLATARAASLGRPVGMQRVAAHLGVREPIVVSGLSAWAAAADPLTGWRSLLRTRWEWATREEPGFSFGGDEVAAYAVKLLILRDWRRTMGVAA